MLGTENLPDPLAQPRRPILFVGNHTLFGLYDLPMLMDQLYLRGFRVRGLAHPLHFKFDTPWKRTFEQFGAVPASPMACFRLLKAGEPVLLYPGGGREVRDLGMQGCGCGLFWGFGGGFGVGV